MIHVHNTVTEFPWTTAGSDDSWLALGLNANGSVDGAWELFGNVSPQPGLFAEWNGFRALAVYDTPQDGGNGDGRIDTYDRVFQRLKLWRDSDHNGISAPNEFSSLVLAGIWGLDLDYETSKRQDGFGNAFRFRARTFDSRRTDVGKWAWDVYLLIAR